MTVSTALQAAIFARLTTYAPLVALIGVRVYDAPPKDAAYPFVSFGPMDALTEDADLLDGAEVSLQLDVWSAAQDGQREAKEVCDTIRAALHRWTANLSTGALAMIEVTRLRTIPDPQEHLTHGIVTVECAVEVP